ncbi:MAG: aminotransferase class III-fold pyridoxal phosphate-dependent enzyme [Deltaproteobacteria bacterium]|nr:MAG: aminotransferase class III-fold pyridoxal phosphate-dependent enzyme [Deltaproteobacteria bacterium]
MADPTGRDLTDLLTPKHDRIDLRRLRRLVERELALYVERTPRSRELADRARKHMIGGVMSSWHGDWHLPHPLYVERAKDNRVWDVDGNEYIDFNLGDTPDMFGHAPDNEVTRSVSDFVRTSGSATLLPSEDAIVASEILSERFGLRYWYSALSASDANRFSIKIARMVTGRPRVLMFNLAYHGTVDETLHWTLEPGVIRRRFHADYAPGQDPATTTKIANWNDLDSVERALQDGDVALVLTEPALTNTGIVLPEPGFHKELRALCSRYGAYLLIDETHTLSEGPRGCTGAWGLEPDFWVAGKAIASGIPCAVYGFSEEIGDRLAALLSSDDPQGVGGMTGIGTTVAGNALSTHALRATLENLLTEEVYTEMRQSARRLVHGMREVIAKHEVPFSITAMGNRCDLRFLPHPARDAFDGALGIGVGGYFEFAHLRALNRGFLIIPYYNMFLCSPTTKPQDVDAWIECFDELVADLLRDPGGTR